MQSVPPAPTKLGHIGSDSIFASPCDVLVLGIDDENQLSSIAARLDADQGGWITRGLQAGTISTKRGDVSHGIGTSPSGPATIMVVGLGDTDLIDRGKAFELGASIIRRIVDKPKKRVVVALMDQLNADTHDSFVAGSITACEGQSLYQSEAAVNPPGTIDFVDVAETALQTGKIVGESVNVTRRLVNEPPNIIYPGSFADVASQIASETGLSVEIWDETKLKSEGCRAILAVGGASVHPPRLVILRHRGGGEDEPLVAIVGKGVTFDSGGLSIKPSDSMMDMKCDMAGAATVVGVLRAAALLQLPINIVGVCGLAENMISGDAYRVGDVIETRSGTTIEIHNTDAEGRVVLADALDVAVQHKPVAIVDLATLTGACMVALGRDTAGLMTNDSVLCDQVAEAAENEGEWAWELPMFSFFDDQVKGKVADIKNVGDGRWGGAITAAKFLEQFVDKTPWVHIDIAGPAFADSPKPHRDAGATGVMVRTLIRWLQSKESA